MSYCRWSTNAFQSDFYIFRDSSGVYHICLAEVRYASVPSPSPAPTVAAPAGTMIPIELPHAGEAFVELTAEAAIARIETLVALGYRLPDGTLEHIRADADG